MSDLFSLQHQFQNYLLVHDEHFLENIISTEKVPREMRLDIYRNAYYSRLEETLASNYPMLSTYVGHVIFEKIAREYTHKFPSEFRSIRWFGDKLAVFLTEHTEYKDFPYLIQFAEFEWKMSLAFDAADSELLTVEEVAKIAPDDWLTMRFRFHASVQRVDLTYPITQIWQDIEEENIPDEPVEYAQPISWLIWRRDLLNRYISLSLQEAFAIDALMRGETFGEVCEGLCEWIDVNEVGNYAASLLKTWLAAGLLISVTK